MNDEAEKIALEFAEKIPSDKPVAVILDALARVSLSVCRLSTTPSAALTYYKDRLAFIEEITGLNTSNSEATE